MWDPGVILVRNRKGNKVHRSTCTYAMVGAVRWQWVDEHPFEDWARTSPWLKQCQVCMPPSPLVKTEKI